MNVAPVPGFEELYEIFALDYRRILNFTTVVL